MIVTTWLIDGNNVFGSRPDGWWNDPPAAASRLTQHVAEWCRSHADDVILVFDGPLGPDVSALAGGNLRIEQAARRGPDAADDRIVELATGLDRARVVTSDRGLRQRLSEQPGAEVELFGVAHFRALIRY